MGAHPRVLSESFPVIPTWQGLDRFPKISAFSCLTIVVLALEGLNGASMLPTAVVLMICVH